MNDSEYNPVESRLLSLEQKVNLLLVAAAIQIVTILISWVSYLLSTWFWTILFLVGIGVALFFFRDQLPALSGKFIRFVFSRPSDPSRPGEPSESDSEVT